MPIFTDNITLRSTEKSVRLGKEAHYTNAPILRIKGPTTLNVLVYDYIRSTAIDQMHLCFSGYYEKINVFLVRF